MRRPAPRLRVPRGEPAWRAAGLGDQTAKIAALIAQHGTTAHDAVLTTAAALDAQSYLRDAGLRDSRLDALRQRMIS